MRLSTSKNLKSEENFQMITDNFNRNALNATECLSQGWELLKANYLIFLGMVVVEIVLVLVASMIPIFGAIASTAIAAPLVCGIYMALLKQYRGERAEFPVMFEGFNRFVPAVVISLVGALPFILFGIVSLFISSLSAAGLSAMGRSGDPTAILRGLGATFILGALVAWLASVVLGILLFFALPLVADRNMNFMDAIKLSISAATANLGGLILLVILEIVVSFVGVIACCVGIVFVMPIVYAANIVAYRQVFPDTNASFNNQPPPAPDAYGGTYGTPQQ